MSLVRLNKYLAEQGIASRREADRLIADGQISVNGVQVTEMGVKVDTDKDKVTVSDKVVERRENLIYLALNKPMGYVSSVKSTSLEPMVVMELIHTDERVYPIGRLDKETTGLLLFTNDGTLTHKLIHPSSEAEKEYEVIVNDKINRGQIEKLKAGVTLKGEKTKKTKVRQIGDFKMAIVLTEGKNRQIRRICQKVGLPVVRLRRVRIKNVKLGDLPLGKTRMLTREEVEGLKS